MANPPVLGSTVEAALRLLSPDPFVQAAIWRVYCEERHLLVEGTLKALDAASTDDAAALKEAPL